MGIFDWFKKKETPAQIARRRIESMPRERNSNDTSTTPDTATTAVIEELPALDIRVLEQPTTWGAALSTQEESQRNPVNVKQKILEHLAERPPQRQWKKSDLQSVQATGETETSHSAQQLEQIHFDQVGVEMESASQHKKG